MPPQLNCNPELLGGPDIESIRPDDPRLAAMLSSTKIAGSLPAGKIQTMRILLVQHGPAEESPGGTTNRLLATDLLLLGHEVRVLTMAEHEAIGSTAISILRTVICSASDPKAELKFPLPRFLPPAPCSEPPVSSPQPPASSLKPQAPGAGGSVSATFAALTDAQLAEYRSKLRDVLDEIIHQFNPHLVHVQHLWILAHLALESGVPYVAQVWGPELATTALDDRYLPLVEQAAENAGRILVDSPSMAADLLVRFDIGSERIALTAPSDAAKIARLYETMLIERYGQVPE